MQQAKSKKKKKQNDFSECSVLNKMEPATSTLSNSWFVKCGVVPAQYGYGEAKSNCSLRAGDAI